MTERRIALFLIASGALVSLLCGAGIVLAFSVAPAYQRMSGFLLALAMLSLGMAGVGWTQLRDLRTAEAMPKRPLPGVARATYRPPREAPESPVGPAPPFPRYRILGVVLFMGVLLGLCGWGVLASGGELMVLAVWGLFLEIALVGLLRRRPWAWRVSFVALLSSACFLAAFWLGWPQEDATSCFGIRVSSLMGAGVLLLLVPLAVLLSCHRSYTRATGS